MHFTHSAGPPLFSFPLFSNSFFPLPPSSLTPYSLPHRRGVAREGQRGQKRPVNRNSSQLHFTYTYCHFTMLSIGKATQSSQLWGKTFCHKIHVWKINKMPEFYMILAKKIVFFFHNFGCPVSRLLRLWCCRSACLIQAPIRPWRLGRAYKLQGVLPD